MNIRHLAFLIPFLLLLALGGLAGTILLRGDDPSVIDNPLIGHAAPPMDFGGWNHNDLKGSVALVNFFASWCPPCEAEHPILTALRDTHKIRIFGVNVRDDTDRRDSFLKRLGNPYAAIADDPKGEISILWGTTGTPETFLIDANGIVRHRFSGPVTDSDVNDVILPMIRGTR